MGIAEKIYQHSLRLPEDAARQALAFVEFLEQQSQHQTATNESLTQSIAAKRQAGSAKHQLIILQDDDAHLADFHETKTVYQSLQLF